MPSPIVTCPHCRTQCRLPSVASLSRLRCPKCKGEVPPPGEDRLVKPVVFTANDNPPPVRREAVPAGVGEPVYLPPTRQPTASRNVVIGVAAVVSAVAVVCGLFLLVSLMSASQEDSAGRRRREVKDVAANGGAAAKNPPDGFAVGGDGEAKNEPVDWTSIGSSTRVGDLEISVMGVAVKGVRGKSYGDIANFTATVVQLRLANKSETRIARYHGWLGDGVLADEHGNMYKPESLPSGFGFDSVPMVVKHDFNMHTSLITHGRDTVIHPGKDIVTYLFFERIAGVSKEARISLPGKDVETPGVVRLRAPIVTPRR